MAPKDDGHWSVYISVWRHIVVHGDGSWHDDGLLYSYATSDDYISPIQHWIEQACSSTHQPWHDLGVFFCLKEFISIFSHTAIEIPTYSCKMFDVVLFWFIAKHKGRSRVVDMI
jgi:hypothetical protein